MNGRFGDILETKKKRKRKENLPRGCGPNTELFWFV